MLAYSLVCKKNAEDKDVKIIKTKNGRVILSSKCVVYSKKKSRFVKQQKTSGILSSVGIRKLLSKIPVLGDMIF